MKATDLIREARERRALKMAIRLQMERGARAAFAHCTLCARDSARLPERRDLYLRAGSLLVELGALSEDEAVEVCENLEVNR